MKSEHRVTCGPGPQPGSSQASRCLPFCGLGAEQYVQGKAALCGVLHPEQLPPRDGELADVVTES